MVPVHWSDLILDYSDWWKTYASYWDIIVYWCLWFKVGVKSPWSTKSTIQYAWTQFTVLYLVMSKRSHWILTTLVIIFITIFLSPCRLSQRASLCSASRWGSTPPPSSPTRPLGHPGRVLGRRQVVVAPLTGRVPREWWLWSMQPCWKGRYV